MTHLTDLREVLSAIGSKSFKLLYFHTDWCPHCKRVTPYLEETLEGYVSPEDIVAVNIDEAEEVRVRFGIQSIPRFALYKDGVCKYAASGEGKEKEIINTIEILK